MKANRKRIMKTTKIRKGEYKIEFNGFVTYAMKYEFGGWGLYEDENREKWFETQWRTSSLKSCKDVIRRLFE